MDRMWADAPDPPHAEHIDEMLLGQIILLVHIPLQRREDGLSLGQRFAALPLHLAELLVGHSRGHLRARQRSGDGDGKVLEFLAEDDDGLFGEEGVLGTVCAAECWVEREGLLRVEETGREGGAVE